MNVFEHYYIWLCDKVGYQEEFDSLLRFLFEVDYYSDNNKDEGRISDAAYLRKEFMFDEGVRGDPFAQKCCSVLEVLVAFANRIEEYVVGDPDICLFWRMVENLGLTKTTNVDIWEEIIEGWLSGEAIDYSGQGGPFPLIDPACDQRGLDLWSQATWWLKQ